MMYLAYVKKEKSMAKDTWLLGPQTGLEAFLKSQWDQKKIPIWIFRAWLLCQALLVLKLFLKYYFLDHQFFIFSWLDIQ